jgi:hypothetical protein
MTCDFIVLSWKKSVEMHSISWSCKFLTSWKSQLKCIQSVEVAIFWPVEKVSIPASIYTIAPVRAWHPQPPWGPGIQNPVGARHPGPLEGRPGLSTYHVGCYRHIISRLLIVFKFNTMSFFIILDKLAEFKASKFGTWWVDWWPQGPGSTREGAQTSSKPKAQKMLIHPCKQVRIQERCPAPGNI